MTTRFPTESSITFSLKELVEIENERVAEESARAARELRAENDRIATKRREEEREQERALAEREEARRTMAREEDAARARNEGHAAALRNIARVEAEAKVRLAADEAARAHELAMLRERLEGRSTTAKRVLAGLLGIAVIASAAMSLRAADREATLSTKVIALEADQARTVGERDASRDAEASAMERQKRAEEAIGAEKSQRVRALEGSVSVLEAWANERRRPEIVAAARSAVARARTNPTDETLLAGARAIDEALGVLATPAKKSGGVSIVEPRTEPGCVDKNDPLCGLNGRGL